MSAISVSSRTKAVSGDLSSTLILALGTFAVGADAFVIAGFLPSVAGALHVSTADGRQAVTMFVVAYAILAPILSLTTARVPRRVLLVTALLVLGLANLVSALAPTLPVLIAGRVLAAAGAAAYTPIAAAVCTSLVRPRRRVPALSVLIGGMAVATTMGLSLGELAGRWLGWRAALGVVALVCLVAGIGVLLTMPWLPGRPRRAAAPGTGASQPSGTSATTSESTASVSVAASSASSPATSPTDRASTCWDASYGWAAKRSADPTPPLQPWWK